MVANLRLLFRHMTKRYTARDQALFLIMHEVEAEMDRTDKRTPNPSQWDYIWDAAQRLSKVADQHSAD